jgi:hypothetical protein
MGDVRLVSFCLISRVETMKPEQGLLRHKCANRETVFSHIVSTGGLVRTLFLLTGIYRMFRSG